MKKTGRYFMLLAMAAAVSGMTLMSACSDDDDDDASTGTGMLKGWTMKAYNADGSLSEADSLIVFRKGGKVTSIVDVQGNPRISTHYCLYTYKGSQVQFYSLSHSGWHKGGWNLNAAGYAAAGVEYDSTSSGLGVDSAAYNYDASGYLTSYGQVGSQPFKCGLTYKDGNLVQTQSLSATGAAQSNYIYADSTTAAIKNIGGIGNLEIAHWSGFFGKPSANLPLRKISMSAATGLVVTNYAWTLNAAGYPVKCVAQTGTSKVVYTYKW